jgi:hypothetical protein
MGWMGGGGVLIRYVSFRFDSGLNNYFFGTSRLSFITFLSLYVSKRLFFDAIARVHTKNTHSM